MASRELQLPHPVRGWQGHRLRPLSLLLLLLASPVSAGAAPMSSVAGAPPSGLPGASPNQPEAIHIHGLTPPPCPLIVPRSSLDAQPLRISPSQVALKNRMGCLSEADAVYGPDGCPLRLCGKKQNPIALPSF